jgi:hypothetical protein
MNSTTRLIAVMAVLAFGCDDAGVGPAVGTEDSPIHVAVYRYQFLHNGSSMQENAGAYYLAVMVMVDSGVIEHYDFRDPPASVLQSFADHHPPVRKYSACTLSPSGVFDRNSGTRGLLFRVGPVRKIGEEEAEVEGGYFEGGLRASSNRYRLEFMDGVWVVVEDRSI